MIRGDEATTPSLPESRQVKRAETWLLATGWAGALLFPLVGIIAGLYIGFARSGSYEGGPKYNDWSRKQAVPMIAVALVVFVTLILLNPRHR